MLVLFIMTSCLLAFETLTQADLGALFPLFLCSPHHNSSSKLGGGQPARQPAQLLGIKSSFHFPFKVMCSSHILHGHNTVNPE